MSREPDPNLNDLPIDHNVDANDEHESDLVFGITSARDEGLIEPREESLDPSDDDDDDFSLSQLSQAYAKLRRTGPDQAPETVSKSNETSDDNDREPNTAKTSKLREAVTVQLIASNSAAREARDNAGCPISPTSIVEAIVFVGLPGDEKLTLKKISSLLRDVSPKEVENIVEQLNARYENDQAAFRIVLTGQSVSMDLHESMLPFQRELSRQNKGVKLNAGTIEVLAVVAYNQPITREKIDDTRKKSSGAIVSQLMKRGLIVPAEGERSLQKQQLVTTEKFLALFHLADLNDLPQGSDVTDLDELLP